MEEIVFEISIKNFCREATKKHNIMVTEIIDVEKQFTDFFYFILDNELENNLERI